MIGAGNVATHLAMAFHDKGKKIVQIYSLHEKDAELLAQKVDATFTTDNKEIILHADLYIIAVNDSAIKDVVNKLHLGNQLVVHTSGSVEMEILSACSTSYGVIYLLQTFTKEHKVDFSHIPFCIEANNKENLQLLRNLAELLTDDVRNISSEQRSIIHLAAVFTCNFTNHMYVLAEEILKKNNIPFDILKPLLMETVMKIKDHDPVEIQTGPAQRNDLLVIEKHLQMLAQFPEYAEIYKLITQSIVNKSQHND